MKPLLVGLGISCLGVFAEAGTKPICDKVSFQDVSYTVCEIDPAQNKLRLFLNDETGRPFGHFSRLEDALAERGEALLFAMNGGMYHSDRRPVGLYIEDGIEEMHLVEGAGPGNFGMVPNGVFCISENRAFVVETQDYLRRKPVCEYATQSGPMLVIEGVLHPRFFPESDSRHIRNGVGSDPEGNRVVFVKSEELVNFHAFATLFRDHLELPMALYLDGNISRLFDAGAGRNDTGFRMGPIIGVIDAKN